MVITVGLTALLGAGVAFWGWQWAPKLALDLQGGTQVILTPVLESEDQEVTQEQLNQAVSIIRQRVDATGVTEAQVSTQGNNIVVEIPGTLDRETEARIRAAAKLEFRPVLLASVPSSSSADTPSATPTDGSTPTPSPSLESTPSVSPTNGSDVAWITPALQDEYDNFDCATLETAATNVAPADEPLVTCNVAGTEKYLLGPVEISGSTIDNATAGMRQSQGVSTGEWVVNITFDDDGTKQFAETTTRLNQFRLDGDDTRSRFAVVLDGKVITAPTTQAAIVDGKPEISGSFTQQSAKILADQLKYGALPISFEVLSTDQISATLGTAQLAAGLIAGAIGLLLVVIYSLFQYRLLGFVTVASLVVAAALTYLVLTIWSWREGYRLSLSGVAGLIVAIGFTADSFIVYFERIRDELRDGRGLVGAVEAGWGRAIRTILAAKSVNLLSAIILFILAVGNVQGFAFTLGVTTVIDVAIVVLFTHPVLQLLATTKFFGSGHPLSGLDPTALGAIYRGRAQFRPSVEARKSGASREAERRQTIAERKAAEAQPSDTRGRGKDA